MRKYIYKLAGQRFENKDVFPFIVVLLCSVLSTIIYAWGYRFSWGIDDIAIKKLILCCFGVVWRYVELAIFLKIALAVMKRGSKFNVLLKETVIVMSITVTVRIAALSAVYRLDLPMLPYYIVLGVCVLLAAGYCFFLAEEIHGLTRRTAIIVSLIYILACITRAIPSMAVFLITLLVLFIDRFLMLF